MGTMLPTQERTTVRRRRRPTTFHYFHGSALLFARTNGLDARAICGRWINPAVTSTVNEVTASNSRRICGNCMRVRESMLRSPQNNA